MTTKNTTNVVLTRSIILNGEVEDEGSEHELEYGLANRLIGEGSARLADGEEDKRPTTVTGNHAQQADHADPTQKSPADRELEAANAKKREQAQVKK